PRARGAAHVARGPPRPSLADQVVAVLAARPGLLPGGAPPTDRGESAREGRTAQGRMPATTSSSGNGLPRGGRCRIRGDRTAPRNRVGADHLLPRTTGGGRTRPATGRASTARGVAAHPCRFRRRPRHGLL